VLDRNDGGVAPKAFQLIEIAQRGVEQVHDDIHVIEQRPASLRDTFGVMYWLPLGLETLHKVLGGAADVRIGCPAGDDEEVSHVRHAAQVKDDNVGRLVVEA